MRHSICVMCVLWAVTGISAEVIYRGQPRTPEWVEEQYEYFKDKIGFADGAFWDIEFERLIVSGQEISRDEYPDGRITKTERGGAGMCLMVPEGMNENKQVYGAIMPFRPGGFGVTRGKVLQVLSRSTVLITYTYNQQRQIDVALLEGVDTSQLIDNAVISDKHVAYCAGTYQYQSAGGVKQIPKLAVFLPLSKEKFIECIQNGFMLRKYQNGRSISSTCIKCKGSGRITNPDRKKMGRIDCPDCRGTGKGKNTDSLWNRIDIP